MYTYTHIHAYISLSLYIYIYIYIHTETHLCRYYWRGRTCGSPVRALAMPASSNLPRTTVLVPSWPNTLIAT